MLIQLAENNQLMSRYLQQQTNQFKKMWSDNLT